jgi:hypothetical protein
MARVPTQEEIQHIMEITGLEYTQAYNHLVQCYELQDRKARGKL